MRIVSTVLVLGALGAAAAGQQPGRPDPQTPPRDPSAQTKESAPAPTGSIVGRVVAADTGRPVKRARVFATAAEMPGGRGILTDDSGAFALTELPAGRYSVNVSKTGFVTLTYGQRRPLQAGTPLQIADGQQLKGVDFSLPRGSVIAGTVLDEDGEPSPGVNVRVMRFQYQQGERRLVPSGNGATDDRGQFRVWGLMPGDYYVNAIAPNRNINNGAVRAAAAAVVAAGVPGRGGRAGAVAAIASGVLPAPGSPAPDGEESLAYAPTYYPGVAAFDEAKPVSVGLSTEVAGINFSLMLVKTARVSGRVTNPDGSPATGGNVNLAAEAGRVSIGANSGGRIGGSGEFTIANVPPGRYVLRARGMPPGAGRGRGQGAELPPLMGSLPVVVSGQDLDSVTVQLAVGATLTGTIVFPPGQSQAADPSQVRVTAPSAEPDAFGGPQPNGRVDKDGRFTMTGIPEGTHFIRAGGGRGWTLKSVSIGGRDVTDTPVQLRSGQHQDDVQIVFTDRVTEINGAITNAQNRPAPDYTILAFPTDSTLWRPQSRQISTARPDQTGKFRIRGLPPGDYYIAAVDPTEQGEWFDPVYLEAQRAAAGRLTLGEGQTLTRDLRIR